MHEKEMGRPSVAISKLYYPVKVTFPERTGMRKKEEERRGKVSKQKTRTKTTFEQCVCVCKGCPPCPRVSCVLINLPTE